MTKKQKNKKKEKWSDLNPGYTHSGAIHVDELNHAFVYLRKYVCVSIYDMGYYFNLVQHLRSPARAPQDVTVHMDEYTQTSFHIT